MQNGFDGILLLQPCQEQVPHAQKAFCFLMGTSAQNQGWHCEGRHGHKSLHVPSTSCAPAAGAVHQPVAGTPGRQDWLSWGCDERLRDSLVSVSSFLSQSLLRYVCPCLLPLWCPGVHRHPAKTNRGL